MDQSTFNCSAPAEWILHFNWYIPAPEVTDQQLRRTVATIPDREILAIASQATVLQALSDRLGHLGGIQTVFEGIGRDEDTHERISAIISAWVPGGQFNRRRARCDARYLEFPPVGLAIGAGDIQCIERFPAKTHAGHGPAWNR